MTAARIQSSRPHHSVSPRWRDRARDGYHYGPLLPAEGERRSLLSRLLGRAT